MQPRSQAPISLRAVAQQQRRQSQKLNSAGAIPVGATTIYCVLHLVLFLTITNVVSWETLPQPMNYDRAIFGARFDTHDTRPVYGLKIEALDKNGSAVAWARVMESYVPPTTETVVVTLPPGAVMVRCEILGPDLAGKWCEGSLSVFYVEPSLEIRKVKDSVELDWFDPGNCWKLQRLRSGSWEYSPLKLLTTNQMELFRLVR